MMLTWRLSTSSYRKNQTDEPTLNWTSVNKNKKNKKWTDGWMDIQSNRSNPQNTDRQNYSSNSKQTASPADRQGRQTDRIIDQKTDRQTGWMDGLD